MTLDTEISSQFDPKPVLVDKSVQAGILWDNKLAEANEQFRKSRYGTVKVGEFWPRSDPDTIRVLEERARGVSAKPRTLTDEELADLKRSSSLKSRKIFQNESLQVVQDTLLNGRVDFQLSVLNGPTNTPLT